MGGGVTHALPKLTHTVCTFIIASNRPLFNPLLGSIFNAVIYLFVGVMSAAAEWEDKEQRRNLLRTG